MQVSTSTPSLDSFATLPRLDRMRPEWSSDLVSLVSPCTVTGGFDSHDHGYACHASGTTEFQCRRAPSPMDSILTVMRCSHDSTTAAFCCTLSHSNVGIVLLAKISELIRDRFLNQPSDVTLCCRFRRKSWEVLLLCFLLVPPLTSFRHCGLPRQNHFVDNVRCMSVLCLKGSHSSPPLSASEHTSPLGR